MHLWEEQLSVPAVAVTLRVAPSSKDQEPD